MQKFCGECGKKLKFVGTRPWQSYYGCGTKYEHKLELTHGDQQGGSRDFICDIVAFPDDMQPAKVKKVEK